MTVTREEIEHYYSNLPLLRPPPKIILLRNAKIRTERQDDASPTPGFGLGVLPGGLGLIPMLQDHLSRIAHDMNHHDGPLRVFGFYRPGTSYITMAGNAKPTTPIHEALHYDGIHSETLAYALQGPLLLRARIGAPIFGRPVHYEERQLTGATRDAMLQQLQLYGVPPTEVDMVELTLAPG